MSDAGSKIFKAQTQWGNGYRRDAEINAQDALRHLRAAVKRLEVFEEAEE